MSFLSFAPCCILQELGTLKVGKQPALNPQELRSATEKSLDELQNFVNVCKEWDPHSSAIPQKENGELLPLMKKPVELIASTGRDEFIIRAHQHGGYSPHQHEPVHAMSAIEHSLQKGVPAKLVNPAAFLQDLAYTGSERFFELPLKHGFKLNMTAARPLFQYMRRSYLKDLNQDIQQRQPHLPQSRESNGEERLKSIFPAWEPEGTRAFGERVLSSLHRMERMGGAYDKVHTFIQTLREQVRNNRQAKLLAELETEAVEPKKVSKSAKKKAREKAAKAHRAELAVQKKGSSSDRLQADGASAAHVEPAHAQSRLLPRKESIPAVPIVAEDLHNQERPAGRMSVEQTQVASSVTRTVLPTSESSSSAVHPQPEVPVKPLKTHSRRKKAGRTRANASAQVESNREGAPNAPEKATTWTDFPSFLRRLSEQPGQRTPSSPFSPQMRQQLRQAEDLMKDRWAAAMQEAALPNSGVVVYSS